MMPEIRFVELKDLTFDKSYLISFGTGVLPKDNMNNEVYVLTVWLSGVREPISITYGTEEDRDKELNIVREIVLNRG